jgi:hypothetical protein
MNLLQDGAIEVFSNTVVLRGVMHGEFLFRSFLPEVHDKFLASVFATSV